jgi:sulfide:quinone oxidoreductase
MRVRLHPVQPLGGGGLAQALGHQIEIAGHLAKKHRLRGSRRARIDAEARQVHAGDGEVLDYDYLLICTGPRLAFDEVARARGPTAATPSRCAPRRTRLKAWEAYQEFVKIPDPMVVGAAQGASCFGPAYEFAMILDADLRKRKIRDRCRSPSSPASPTSATWAWAASATPRA